MTLDHLLKRYTRINYKTQSRGPAGRATQAQSSRKTGPARHRLKTADQLIKGLAATQGTHLKVPVLNNSYLVPVHRVLQGLLALYD